MISDIVRRKRLYHIHNNKIKDDTSGPANLVTAVGRPHRVSNKKPRSQSSDVAFIRVHAQLTTLRSVALILKTYILISTVCLKKPVRYN